MNKFDAIVYKGRAVAFVIQEYSTRRSIELLQNIPHKFYKILSPDEVAHYNKLCLVGVRLLEVEVPAVVQEDDKKLLEVDTNLDIESTTDENLVDTTEESLVGQEDEDISDEVAQQLHELEVPDVGLIPTNDDSKEVAPIDEVNAIEVEVQEGYEGELAEYLDMNYDNESILKLASDLEVKGIRSNYRKDTVIGKIIESAYDQVYKIAFKSQE